ncbi:MAG: LPS-assembly protein LptD [SAR324 cluster bacterium]|nr:LPS-assembly protein LptD [SAR324 cluster bacterium]
MNVHHSQPVPIFLLIAIGFCFLWNAGVSQVSAQGLPELKIEAQSPYFDQINQLYRLKNATLNWSDISLDAGEVEIDLKNKKLTATGFVRFADKRIIAILDRLEIDMITEKGIFYNVVIYDAVTKAYLTAKEATKLDKIHFVAKQCSITTCNPEDPVWKITGKQVDYQKDNFSSTEGATLLVKDIPVFYFPYLLWPTVTRRQSGFLAPEYQSLESSEDKFDLGFKLRVPYFWAVTEDQNLTFLLDFIGNRGMGAGFEYEYAFREGLRGNISFWQIQEREKRDPAQESGRLLEEEIEGSQLHPPRYKLKFNHNQTLGERTRFLISGQIFSDSQFQREYDRVREPNPNYAQHLNTSVSRQFDVGDISFLVDRELVYEEVAILNQNFIETRVQRLPEITGHYSDTPWSFPLTLEMNGVATRFHRDEGVIGWREIFTPRLYYRFSPSEGINATVSYGRRLSSYQVYNPSTPVFYQDRELALDSREHREFSHGIDVAEAEVKTTLSRVIIPESTIFSRFKHLITPRLLFESIGDVNQDKTRSVVLPTIRVPNPDPVDFFDKEDSLPGKQLLILRFDNLLLAKKHLLGREVTLTDRSLQLLKNSKLNAKIIKKLEEMINQKFFSENEFFSALTIILGNRLTPEQEKLILSYLQKGVRNRRARAGEEVSRESKSWVFSRLNIIQRFNLLRQDKNYDPKGPGIEDQETAPGEPLLPLNIEWNLTPGPEFSVDFFLRYDYQASRVVESKATFNVQIGPSNQAQIRFHNNETSYRTPDDVFHEKTNTLAFGSVFEAQDDLSFGFNGKLNLNVSDESALRRRLIEDSFFINYHPLCYVVSLIFKEQAEQTVTSGGERKEIIDSSVALTISLGQVLPLPEQTFRF